MKNVGNFLVVALSFGFLATNPVAFGQNAPRNFTWTT